MVLGEMAGKEGKGGNVLLKLGKSGVAFVAGDMAGEMDVIHFSVERGYKATFESNVAAGECARGVSRRGGVRGRVDVRTVDGVSDESVGGAGDQCGGW